MPCSGAIRLSSALEQFLPEILERFFPETHALIDWSRPFEFLEQELKKVLPPTDGGSRKPWRVDKLIRVFLRDGGERWLLIHLEVQSFPEEDFTARIFGYYCRLQAAFGRDVLPLVILADGTRGWHPKEYRHELGNVSLRLRFDTCKLRKRVFGRQAEPARVANREPVRRAARSSRAFGSRSLEQRVGRAGGGPDPVRVGGGFAALVRFDRFFSAACCGATGLLTVRWLIE